MANNCKLTQRLFVILVTLFLHLTQSESSAWTIVTDPVFPYPFGKLAAATFNSSIFIICWESNDDYQLIEYDTELNTMEYDINGSSLNFGSYYYGGHFAQVMNFLFHTSTSSNMLYIFDLETETFDIVVGPHSYQYPCITSSNDTLFVISYTNKIQSLNITSNTWQSYLQYPALSISRYGAACAYQPTTNRIYAIGGDGSYAQNSFEKLFVKNSYYDHESWALFDIAEGIEPILYSRAVAYEQYILIYGGRVYDDTDVDYRQNILVLNAFTDEFLPAIELNWKIRYGALVIVPTAARAYMFGGVSTRGASYPVTSWQYYDLPFTFEIATSSETPTKHTTSYTTKETEATTSISSMLPSKDAITTQLTMQCSDLHFVCFYNDHQFETSEYIKFVSLMEYASMMRNATLSSIESVTYRSVDYNRQSVNRFTAWKRGGILEFEICNVFNTELSEDCPQYKKRGTKAKYIAIGTFGVMVDQEVDKFASYIINEMISDEFAQTLTEKMQIVLNGIVSEIVFETIQIKIFGNCAIETTESGNFGQAVKSKDAVVVVVVVLVVLAVIIVALLVLIAFFKKRKDEEERAEDKEVELAQPQNDDHKTDKDNVQEGVLDILDDINRANETYDIHMNKDADDDIVNEINDLQRT